MLWILRVPIRTILGGSILIGENGSLISEKPCSVSNAMKLFWIISTPLLIALIFSLKLNPLCR